ncbi:Fructoselysine-6-P-deglycase FrlB with duplicated sugar isomerase (SIS) domain [Sanguibacter gelidistatuariae]|uniref:Fructoselysine-6-P-deglycase FrlB with duplicated sugar isomerase (SIS) domain n=1 Tax=Sanguibacter gelidistatuariae TaxID=1814289 RepID=A0A1G6H8Q1_9MICO|nr:sugar isomerase [Sanguibacter gelidistatuariae]SDB90533.1 Fructoselysine-6-P-deglycase FrlB with duplicated sugar isomerase (SIS) domain [Sanguibacter gelidistatuariae]
MSSTTSREIASQPDVWARALTDAHTAGAVLGQPGDRTLILGCGTSAFVAESLAALREAAGQGETDAAYASEWRPGRRYDRVVAISRSGTTTEVVDALRLVPDGPVRAGILGVAGTTLDLACDESLVLDYADESSVVQTRFPTTVLALARASFDEDLTGLVEEGRTALAAPLPVRVQDYDHFVFLGTSWTYGLAQEAALKIREAAQAWSESYPALDYRHGPIAVAHPGTLVMLFGALDRALAADIERTGARVWHIDADPLVQLLQAQRLAVELAESRGLSPDRPRHLTRSVVLD